MGMNIALKANACPLMFNVKFIKKEQRYLYFEVAYKLNPAMINRLTINWNTCFDEGRLTPR